jgi:riboflavin biosynthesis pyrimidine reductase
MDLRRKQTGILQGERDRIADRGQAGFLSGRARVVEAGRAASLQRLDLVDEYRFAVHPVVAGHGPLLFSGLQPSWHLKFVSATRLKSSIVVAMARLALDQVAAFHRAMTGRSS